MPRILGLINARAGSKGIPGKNIKPLFDKPLIAWSIETAKKCPLITRTIVSTDSEDIAKVAKKYGAETPFLRPDELATDQSLQIDVIIHAVEWLEKNENDKYDYICLLQPTSPLRSVVDIQGTLELIIDTKADSAVTVCSVGGHHPHIYYKMNINSQLLPYIDTPQEGVGRQSFPELYRRTGSVYALRRENLKNRSLYGSDIRGYEVPIGRSVNIDEESDWEFAEFMLYKMKEKGKL